MNRNIIKNIENLENLKFSHQTLVDLDFEKSTIVLKNKSDTIICGKKMERLDEKEMPRRCGGQGDIFAGLISALCAWKKLFFDEIKGNRFFEDDYFEPAVSACRIMEHVAELAFENHGRSVLASDMIGYIETVVKEIND